MGCGNDFSYNESCVCKAVNAIKDAQDGIEKCKTSCFSNLLSPTVGNGDTIPFILKDCAGNPFHAQGNTGANSCFVSIWFRVENIDDCCATLRILRPFKTNGPLCPEELVSKDRSRISLVGACELDSLRKTNNCIEVDLKCFSAIQCLSPSLVGN
jgi:hypothetical protein